jgi:molybdenum cofactor cytidylyltransferase
MKFGPIPLDQAEGKILAHNIAGLTKRHAFRKGKPLLSSDIAALRELGYRSVYAAELEPGDVGEDAAASRVALAACGSNLSVTRAHVGRVNLQAQCLGVLSVNAEGLFQLNEIEGVTLATLPDHSVVHTRQTVATAKIIPFAIPEERLRTAEAAAGTGRSLLALRPLQARRVHLILSGSPWANQRVMDSFEAPLRTRIEALGSQVNAIEFISIEGDHTGGHSIEGALVQAVQGAMDSGAELIVVAGETGIMDSRDWAPAAIESMGGEVACFGAPVDPGNLIMVAYLGKLPILGAPGCARSLRFNIIDWVLPRMLVGERLTRADLVAMGHGGLLESQPELAYSASTLSVLARKSGERAE